MSRTIIVLAAGFLCAACAMQDNSYERHRLSQLKTVAGSADQFVFEARAVPGMQRDAPEAEAVRLQWLSDWLDVRGTCKPGYEILERRLYEAQEFNPRESQFRYLIRCRTSRPD